MAAGNAIIGALRVVLGADTADFEKGLKGAQASLSTFASGIGRTAAVVGAAAAAYGGVLGIAIKSVINDFDNLSKTSQKIGVPVDELSALRHAASLSDVSVESLDKGIARLARNMVEAAQGSETPRRAFEALGISVRNSDGSFKSMSQLLPQIADRFAKMPDGPVKTALAMQLLGRAGADLIPLLNGGKSGLLDMTNEAKKLGLVISAETGIAAENFNDNLTRLGAVMRGVLVQTTANILPALARLSQYLVDSAKNSGFLEAATNVLTTSFNAFARLAIVVSDNIGMLVKIGAVFIGAQIGAAAISFGLAFVKLAAAIRATGIALALFEAIRGISTRGLLLIAGIVALAAGAFDNFSEKIKSIGNWISTILPEGAGERATQILENLGVNLNGLTANLKSWQGVAGKDGGGLFNPGIINRTKDALQKFIDTKNKQIAVLEAEKNAIGKSTFEADKAKIVAEGLAIATQNHIPITDQLRAELDRLAEAHARANLAATFGKQVYEQTRTPLEQYRAEIERLNMAFDYGKTNSDLYARGVAQAQQQFAQADPYARAFGQSLETAFGKAIDGGSKFSDILRSLLQDLTKALANEAFRSLLYGGKGGTSGGLVGGLIGGIGKLFGFASGGSFQVGGAGGIDSQLVAFKASPNERVSVTKPGQGMGGGTVINMPVNIDARGADQAAVVRIGQSLQELDRSIEKRLGAAMHTNRIRGTRF